MDNLKSNPISLMNDYKHRIFKTVFTLMSIRIFYLILVPPFIGIANNGDFQRLMMSVGLNYPCNIWLPENYDTYFWRYIVNDAIFIEPINTGWHQIFEIFPRIAILLSNKIDNGFFDIRYLGAVNASVYLIGIFLLIRNIERIQGTWSYVFLGLTVLIFSDSYILQYFNSFYTEVGSVSSTIILYSILWYIFSSERKMILVYAIPVIILTGIISLFTVLSKQQDILLVVPVMVMHWLLFKKFDIQKHMRLILSAVFFVVVAILFTHNSAVGNVGAFNVTSMDLLKYSSKPQAHLEAMGFNDTEVEIFMQGIGENMFSENSPFKKCLSWEDYEQSFTRINELKIIFKEPHILLDMISSRSENLFKDDPILGNYMENSGAAPYEKTKENRMWSNIKSAIFKSNFVFYISTICFASLFSFFGRKSKIFSFIPKDLFWLYLMVSVTSILRFMTIMLGDSSHDDIKHFFALNIEFDILFAINCCAIVYMVLHKTALGILLNNQKN